MSEANIRAAFTTFIAVYYDQGDLDLTMRVGFGADGQLYEIGYAMTDDPGDPTLIVHAMAARPQYLPPEPTRDRTRRPRR